MIYNTYGLLHPAEKAGFAMTMNVQVDHSFDHIIIQPGTLSSDVYHYKILNSTGELDSGSFVVQ